MNSRSRILLYFAVAAVFLIVGITVRLPQLLEDPVTDQTGGLSLGGPFTLIDPKGNEVTDEDLLGSYTLVYFGYTFCPDVCPTGLQTAATALELLPLRKSNKVISLFITVDPERDTPEVMGEYVQHFHKSLVGLTGSPEQIQQAAKSYRVYYKKVVEKGKESEDYLVDHSAFQYLMGPDGKFLTHFRHDVTADEMAVQLAKIIR